MDLKRAPILVVETSDQAQFEEKCKQLFEADYKMVSSSCGFVNSEEYQFCSSYQAIFQDNCLDL